MPSATDGKQSGKKKSGRSAPGAPPPQVASDDATVLDTSDAGAPQMVAQTGSGGPTGVMGNAPEVVPPGQDVIVEVEFAPGQDALGSALTGNTAGFLGAAAEATPSPGAQFGAVLNRFGLQAAQPVFTREQIQSDEDRVRRLRELAATGAAAPEQLSALEVLPPLSSYVRLHFPPGTSPDEVTAALKRLPQVSRAVLVPSAAPPGPVPPDPLIGNGQGPLAPDLTTGLEWQWYLHRTRALQAWRYAHGAGVVVADIDWGYRITHQEFQDSIELTYNAVDGGNDVTQGGSAAHGTAVLGIAGARANNGGMTGYAPMAALWAIQGDSAPGTKVFAEPWAEAIDFVRRTDAGGRRKVIILEVQTNPLFGNYEQIPSVHRAIRAAIAEGCVVCVAAGNGDRPADRTDGGDPFDPTGSILVGATAYDDRVNKRAWFSNYGSRVVVSAPGDPSHDLTCAQSADNSYRNGFGGTSGATPKVAGAAALMLSVNPQLSHDEIRDILVGTGVPIAADPGKPIGVFLNVEAAVAEALRRRSESQPAEPLVTPDGLSIPIPPTAKSLHGTQRRVSQMVLPQETGGAISWASAPETAAPALEADMASPLGEQPPAGDRTLRTFRDSVEGTLMQQDKILIVAQAIQMLDNFYVHRPLKEAIHAVRPVQRLRVLQRRLQQAADIPVDEQDELKFHNTLTQIFNSMRDLHTSYQLPRPYRDYIAYLPFEVAPFYEDNQRRYLVTRVVPGYSFADPQFGPGAELIYWNGMAIERAIHANAEQTAGGNDAARHARGVSALTIRPMNTALPPDADFVDLEFLAPGANAPAEPHRMRQHWFVRYAPTTIGGVAAVAVAPAPVQVPAMAPAAIPDITFSAQSSLDLGRESIARASDLLFPAQSPAAVPATAPAAASAVTRTTSRIGNLALAAVLGLDTAADSVREARQLIFESTALRELEQANVGDERYGIRGSASPTSVEAVGAGVEIAVKVPWNAAFRARTIDIGGATYGHIQIRTFYVEDADGFVQEFVRLLDQMPERGLILDVRGNGGGNIWAAERLLQTLVAAEIEPERMQFIVTPGTLDLCRNNPAASPIPLDQWLPSLEEAVETASIYSHAFSLTSRGSCNTLGQKYYGPVTLVVDGNCYSATDIFTAGFQDHNIGKILGVSTNTGAGGANVWEHRLLNELLPAGWGLKPLPNQAGMRVAIRQCLRVGQHAGALLEDFGVLPDAIHRPTREDVLEGDRMLLARAAELLAAQPTRSIKVTMGNLDAANPGMRQVNIESRGLKRLDFRIDGRPRDSRDLDTNAADEAKLTPFIRVGAALQLTGYASPSDSTPAALYLGKVN